MKDLDKLEELFETFKKALWDIEDVIEDVIDELNNYYLKHEVEEIYNKIDELQAEVYGLIQEKGD